MTILSSGTILIYRSENNNLSKKDNMKVTKTGNILGAIIHPIKTLKRALASKGSPRVEETGRKWGSSVLKFKGSMVDNNAMFKKFFGSRSYVLGNLMNEKGIRKLSKSSDDQWIVDCFEKLDRSLTKGKVSDAEKAFCANVVLALLKLPGKESLVFDKLEALVGTEHVLRDLATHNADLRAYLTNK